MRKWMCVTLLGVFFGFSPLVSSEAAKQAAARLFRGAVCDCLLEAGRIGVVDCWKSQVWCNRFCSWMDGEDP